MSTSYIGKAFSLDKADPKQTEANGLIIVMRCCGNKDQPSGQPETLKHERSAQGCLPSISHLVRISFHSSKKTFHRA